MAEIEIRMNRETLQVTVEGDGFQGAECLSAIDALQRILDMATISEDPKDELTYGQTSIEARST